MKTKVDGLKHKQNATKKDKIFTPSKRLDSHRVVRSERLDSGQLSMDSSTDLESVDCSVDQMCVQNSKQKQRFENIFKQFKQVSCERWQTHTNGLRK